MRNFYNILAIEKNATNSEVKKAYKLLMLEHHPDRKQGNYDPELFREIQLAYDMLIDTNIRIAYNKYITIKGMENNTQLFLELNDLYNVFLQFYEKNKTYYSSFLNSRVELYEFIEVELCCAYLSSRFYKFKKNIEYPKHINYYMLYRELEYKKRFTFEELLTLYAQVLENGHIEFRPFLVNVQENYKNEEKKVKFKEEKKNENKETIDNNNYSQTKNYNSSYSSSSYSKKNDNTIHIIMTAVIAMTFLFARMQVSLIDIVPVCPYDGLFNQPVAMATSPACNAALITIQYNCIFLVICEVIVWVVLATRKQKTQVQEI